MATRKIEDPVTFCNFLSHELRKRGVPRFLIGRIQARCLREAKGMEVPGMSGHDASPEEMVRKIRQYARFVAADLKEPGHREAAKEWLAIISEMAEEAREKLGKVLLARLLKGLAGRCRR